MNDAKKPMEVKTMENNDEYDINEVFQDLVEELGDAAHLLSQYMYSIIYDKVDKYPQINREFARILCNMVIILDIITKFGRTRTAEKIKSLENKRDEEIKEFNENVERFIKCFENKERIDTQAWRFVEEHFSLQIYGYIKQMEANEYLMDEFEKFKDMNNKVYDIIERYRTKELKNIMKLPRKKPVTDILEED